MRGVTHTPRCIVIAGPNGAGKTTFAREFLPKDARVKQGGHHVPRADVLRRFQRGWLNFQKFYRPLADVWAVYDNSGTQPLLLEQGP